MDARVDISVSLREYVICEYPANVEVFELEKTYSNAWEHYVGVSDGEVWGWWGPIDHSIATLIEAYLSSCLDTSEHTPDEWSAIFKRKIRHAHTGIGSICIGVIELAVLDLVAKREKVPVWALFTQIAQPQKTSTYATCFGVDVTNSNAIDVSKKLHDRGWKTQKWKMIPNKQFAKGFEILQKKSDVSTVLCADFLGEYDLDVVTRFLDQVSTDLFWVEEPCNPDQIDRLNQAEFQYRLAWGERVYVDYEVDILERSGAQIWQLDALSCGGFFRLLEIMSRAQRTDRLICPHGSAVIPALHAAAIGFQTYKLEWNIVYGPLRQLNFQGAILPDDDIVMPIPDAPGWIGRPVWEI